MDEWNANVVSFHLKDVDFKIIPWKYCEMSNIVRRKQQVEKQQMFLLIAFLGKLRLTSESCDGGDYSTVFYWRNRKKKSLDVSWENDFYNKKNLHRNVKFLCN
jgi:hypothetical protein